MELNNSSASADVSVPSSEKQSQLPQPPVPAKKKRNLPGMPDPEAEVVALSPATLLATNRFVCEICNKGFQRDQNLQLHRRGHNLPWKLKQRNGAEVRKKVYVCPEPCCVHHDPLRALGDLTGIKKHFCRKHGEKKWKCDKCSKKYAVMSDWKAHLKTCGTREYRCDCGTLFSRRDSFLTHRAFCDALTEENGKTATAPLPLQPPPAVSNENQEVEAVENCEKGVEAAGKENAPTAVDATPVSIILPPTAVAVAAQTVGKEQEETENSAGLLQHMAAPPLSCMASTSPASSAWTDKSNSNCSSTSSNRFANILSTAVPATTNNSTTFSNLSSSMSQIDPPHVDSTLLCLSNNGPESVFSPQQHQFIPPPPSSSSPYLSATALLQKAAEMGPVRSGSSFLKGFGLDITLGNQETMGDNRLQWRQDREQLAPLEPAPLLSAGLGLGLSYEQDTMMGSNLFGAKPATLDFLGLGMGPVAGNANGQISSLITSINGPQDVGSRAARGPFGGTGSPGKKWESSETKPGSSTIL